MEMDLRVRGERVFIQYEWVVGSACAGRDAWQSESRMSRMSESQVKR